MPKGYTADGRKKRISPATRCAVCRHVERPRIESLRCVGVSLDKLSEQFGVHRDAIWRHMEKHVSDERKAGYLVGAGKIAKLAEVAAEESESILDYLIIMRSGHFALWDRAMEAGDHAAAAVISARLIDILDRIGKLTGQIGAIAQSTVINVQNNVAIVNSAPFTEMQAGLIEICSRRPDVRADIIELIDRLDAKFSAAPSSPMKTIGAAPVLEARQ